VECNNSNNICKRALSINSAIFSLCRDDREIRMTFTAAVQLDDDTFFRVKNRFFRLLNIFKYRDLSPIICSLRKHNNIRVLIIELLFNTYFSSVFYHVRGVWAVWR